MGHKHLLGLEGRISAPWSSCSHGIGNFVRERKEKKKVYERKETKLLKNK